MATHHIGIVKEIYAMEDQNVNDQEGTIVSDDATDD